MRGSIFSTEQVPSALKNDKGIREREQE